MKKQGLFAAALAAVALCAGSALALDIGDVKNLVANNVDEAVIIGMIQQEGGFSATAGDIAELQALGASSSLVSAIGAATPSTGEYILEDGTTVALPQGTATYAPPANYAQPVQPPTVYYAAPPPVVVHPTYVYPVPRRHYYRSRPGFSFSFGFGDRPRRFNRRWR